MKANEDQGAKKMSAPRERLEKTPFLSPPRRRIYILIIFSAIVYLNTLPNQFVFDDVDYIVMNPYVQRPGNPLEAFVQAYPPHKPELSLYRPVVAITYLVDWCSGLRSSEFADFKLGDRADTRHFHLTNILIHIGATLALFFLARRFAPEGDAPFFAALVFAVHPVHTEAVASIVGRAETMSALFFLLSLLLYIEARRKVRLWSPPALGAWLFFLLALLCKESAVTLPPVLLLTEMYLHRKKILIPGGMEASDPAGWKRAIRDATIRILPFAAVFILYMNVRLRVLGFVGIKETEWYFAGLSAAVRLSAMCAGFLVYLRLLLFPVGMSHDYNLPVRVWGPFWAELPQSFLNGWALAGLAAFLLILGWSLRAAWRGRPEGYGIVLFFVTMFPFSNIMPFGDFIAERFLYLPSAGVCLAGGVLLARFGKQPGRSRLALAILVAIVAGYSVRTILRNRDWKSGVTIWESELRHNSRNPNLYTGLGAEYGVERGEHLGRGNIYRARGDYKNAAAHLELAMEYEKKALDVLALAIEKNPRDYWTYYNYGGLATEMREPDTVLAEEILLKGAACMPENLRSLHVFYYYLGMIHLKRKPPNMDMALEFFRKAHRLKRSDRRIKNTLAAALGEVGRYDEAIALTRSILKEQPHNREAVKNLRLLRAAVLRRQVTPGPVFPDRL